MKCLHGTVQCLNPFELVRKYRCEGCGHVMMCGCDREIGERFLRHQLRKGCVLETQERVPVTLGFVEGVCRECRGLAPEPHPVAAIPGRTSKIRRYYWREIQFTTFRRFAGRATNAGLDPHAPYAPEAQMILKEAEREALEEIKRLHATSPKYVYQEASQADVLFEYSVDEVRLDATFAPRVEGKAARIIDGHEVLEAEEFVARHYARAGWNTTFTESVPFHILFGTLMWPLIQDPGDPLARIVSFGSRSDHEASKHGVQIHTSLPSDFGSAGYAERRANAIEEHLNEGLHGSLDSLFDHWLDDSADLREYLWAHREADVQRTRELISVLPASAIVRILRYLVGDYWGRFNGWPDLLAYKEGDYFFAEVKASRDKLSGAQKRWIADNANELRLPFKLVKIHRVATQTQS